MNRSSQHAAWSLALVGGVAFIIMGNVFASVVSSDARHSYATNLSDPDSPEFLHPVRPQSSQERTTVRTTDVEEVGERPSLSNPFTVQLVDTSIYVMDIADQQIHQYAIDGSYVRTYGEGQGTGPGEHLLLTGFGVTSDGRVAASDVRRYQISMYDESGTFERAISSKTPPLRLSVTSSDIIAYLTAPTAVHFHDIDNGNTSVGEALVRDSIEWVAALDGGLRSDPDGGVIQFFFYYDVLVRWKSDGAIDYIREMIGEYPPTPIQDSPGVSKQVAAGEVSYYVNDVSVHGDEIHVLVVFLQEDDQRERVVDVYSLQRGDYQYSYSLPEYVRGISVGTNRLVGLQDTTFVVWEAN